MAGLFDAAGQAATRGLLLNAFLKGFPPSSTARSRNRSHVSRPARFWICRRAGCVTRIIAKRVLEWLPAVIDRARKIGSMHQGLPDSGYAAGQAVSHGLLPNAFLKGFPPSSIARSRNRSHTLRPARFVVAGLFDVAGQAVTRGLLPNAFSKGFPPSSTSHSRNRRHVSKPARFVVAGLDARIVSKQHIL